MVLAVPAARMVPAAAVDGKVAVVHDGAALDPDCRCCPAVAVPARIAMADAVE
jgi:hypothetical protein